MRWTVERELPEMTACEGATGAWFQVALEAKRLRFSGEFDGDDDRPRTVIERVSWRAEIVPLEAPIDVTRDADVVAPGIRLAPQDVDEASADSAHGKRWRTDRAKLEPLGFRPSRGDHEFVMAISASEDEAFGGNRDSLRMQ